MEWYYADGTTKVGPLSDQEFRSLISSGLIRTDTLVWHPKMTDWETYGELSGFNAHVPFIDAVGLAASKSRVICSECHQDYVVNDVISYRGVSVCSTCRPQFIQKITEGDTSTAVVRYAGFTVRSLAKITDIGFICLLNFIITVPLAISFTSFFETLTPYQLGGYGGLAMCLSFLLYNTFFITHCNATPGKMFFNLETIAQNGKKTNLKHSLGRALVELLSLSLLGVGYLSALFDSNKRALHDYVGRTRVVVTSRI